MITIAELTLLGTILIGLGLIIQGWFILDLNKRITQLMSKVWLEKIDGSEVIFANNYTNTYTEGDEEE